MTEPQPEPQPQPDPQPQPTPDDPGQGGGQGSGQGGQPEPQPDDDGGDAKVLKSKLDSERYYRRKAEKERDDLQRANLSENERAVAEAKEAGRLEARKESATKLAGAQLRAAAAGKLPAEVVAEISPERFVTDDGEVDEDAISKLVDKLAKAVPTVPNGKVPAGARSSEPASDDWLRDAMSRGRR